MNATNPKRIENSNKHIAYECQTHDERCVFSLMFNRSLCVSLFLFVCIIARLSFISRCVLSCIRFSIHGNNTFGSINGRVTTATAATAASLTAKATKHRLSLSPCFQWMLLGVSWYKYTIRILYQCDVDIQCLMV